MPDDVGAASHAAHARAMAVLRGGVPRATIEAGLSAEWGPPAEPGAILRQPGTSRIVVEQTLMLRHDDAEGAARLLAQHADGTAALSTPMGEAEIARIADAFDALVARGA